MALAWNAGWVNSPRGFKSRILRAQFQGVTRLERREPGRSRMHRKEGHGTQDCHVSSASCLLREKVFWQPGAAGVAR